MPLGVPTERGLSIRGAAYGTGSSAGLLNGAGGISIRGESGPATVLITNLDPAVNADDVRVSFCITRSSEMERTHGRGVLTA